MPSKELTKRLWFTPLTEDIRWVATPTRVHIMRDNWHFALCGMWFDAPSGTSTLEQDIPEKRMCKHCWGKLEDKHAIVEAYLERISDAITCAHIEENRP